MEHTSLTRRAVAVAELHIARRPARLDRRGRVIDPPEVEVVSPRQLFEAPSDTVARLVEAGHAVALDDDGAPLAALPPLIAEEA